MLRLRAPFSSEFDPSEGGRRQHRSGGIAARSHADVPFGFGFFTPSARGIEQEALIARLKAQGATPQEQSVCCAASRTNCAASPSTCPNLQPVVQPEPRPCAFASGGSDNPGLAARMPRPRREGNWGQRQRPRQPTEALGAPWGWGRGCAPASNYMASRGVQAMRYRVRPPCGLCAVRPH
jgi:hypothetical protein